MENNSRPIRFGSPCPLLAQCSQCQELIPIVDFYRLSHGRLAITGEKRSNICRYCSLQNYRNLDPRVKLYYSAKQRAKKLNVAFNLAPDDIVIPTHCPALGVELKDYTGSGKPDFSKHHDAATIDRIDNLKGYTAGNIRVISKRANLLKKDGSVQELAGILSYMLGCEGRSPEVANALRAIATGNHLQQSIDRK